LPLKRTLVDFEGHWMHFVFNVKSTGTS